MIKKRIAALILIGALSLSCAWGEPQRFPAVMTCAAAEALTAREITIPEGVERIESQAFAGTGLERATLPESLEYIAPDAFDESVRFIVHAGSYAASWAPFERIDRVIGAEPEDWHEVLEWDIIVEDERQMAVITESKYPDDAESIILPDELDGVPVRRIGDAAFYDSGVKHIRFPSGLEQIGVQAFGSCEQLLEVRIPNSVTEIGSGAFSGCSSLSKIVLPAGLEDVHVPVFINCEALTDVTMSVGFQTGWQVFENCPNVRIIHYLAGNTGKLPYQVAESSVFLEHQSKRSLKTLDFGEGITEICSNAFYYSRFEYESDGFILTTIHFPSTLKTIGDHAFYGLTHLTDVTLPDGLVTLDHEAFARCSSLIPPEIPDSVINLGDNIFDGCKTPEPPEDPGPSSDD